ncbi:hypothetical protein PA01_18410 [Azoarcus sp. PA01]|nr:hypothetical protein PA01_18410 [Azoarcus sp. PA01]
MSQRSSDEQCAMAIGRVALGTHEGHAMRGTAAQQAIQALPESPGRRHGGVAFADHLLAHGG